MTTQPALSAEAKLVLYLLSRSWMDDARIAAIKSVLSDRFDWDSIVQSAS
jgi:hypothetical protein